MVGSFFLLLVVEGGADGGAELGVFGDVETDFVEFLEHGVDVLALGQEGEVADEDKVLDAGIERREDGGRADGLQHHDDDAEGKVFLGGVVLGFGEQRGCGIHGQSGQRMGGDVANEEIDVVDVALHGQTLNLLGVAGVEHDAAEALQRAAANADTADVVDVVAAALDKAGAGAHGDDDGFGQSALEACS